MPFLNDLKYGLEENSTSGPDLKKLLAPWPTGFKLQTEVKTWRAYEYEFDDN